MNSVKNAIVTMTLLAVGYGAYVVMNNPAPEEAQLAGEDWGPEVSIPETSEGAGNGQVSLDPDAFASDADSEWAADEPPTFAPPENSYAARDSLDEPQSNSDAEPSNFYTADTDGQQIPNEGDRFEDPDELPSFPDESVEAEQYVSTDAGDGYSDADYPTTSADSLPYQGENDGEPPADSGFAASWDSVQSDLAAGALDNALLSLSAWYDEPSLTDQQRQSLQELLDQLAGTVIYSAEPYIEPAHVVQAGETLGAIAKQYNVPSIFLARINGIDEVQPDMELKVLRGPFRAEVNGQTGYITLFLGRHYAGRFAARLGPDMPADAQNYQVVAIQLGREYFDQVSGERIGRDHPDNPYGARWIGLRGEQVTAAHSVGIHVDMGTDGRGCLGVSEQDADDLSAILSIGSRISVFR